VRVAPKLQVLDGGAVPEAQVTRDPWEFQAACVEAFVASWRARGFSPVTIGNDIGQLERTLKALGRPAWEVTPEDIDRVVGDLAAAGRTTATRREYVQVFKGFHRFLQARKAAEIQAAFGVRLVCPVDEFNASRHVGDDSPAELLPPVPERVSEFFDFLKTRIATSRKYAPAARDYAMFRTLYHAGLRSEEAALLDRPDVHFGRGPFGKLHVRFGKGACGRGPKPRLVPAINGAATLIDWWLAEVRHQCGPDWADPDAPLLPSERFDHDLDRCGRVGANALRRTLGLQVDRWLPAWSERLTPHVLRHYCASSLYGAGMDIKALQELLGHQWLSTTSGYIHVRSEHVEMAWRNSNQRVESRFTEDR
jgi:site-specific recombinase XerD